MTATATKKKGPRERLRDWPQRVYKYAVLNAEVPESVWALARRMQTLWNKLCERHAEVREQVKQLIETADVQHRPALQAAFDSAEQTRRAEIDARIARDANTLTAKQRTALWGAFDKWVNSQQKLLETQVKQAISDAVAESRTALWVEFNDWKRAQLEAADLGWECGPDIIDRFDRACRRAASDRKQGFIDTGWPRPGGLSVSLPHRYTGGGAPLVKLSSTRVKRLQFSQPLDYTQTPGKHGRRQLQTLRLGTAVTDEDYIIARVMQHRPIPANAIVKSVRWVGRRTAAFGWDWHICIQVEEPHGPAREKTKLTAAIDVGWRKFADYIRIGYLIDSTGHQEELRLPLAIGGCKSRRFNKRNQHKPGFYPMPENYDQLRALQGQRDTALDTMKARMSELIGADLPSQSLMRRGALCRILSELEVLSEGQAVLLRHDGTEVPVRDELVALPTTTRQQLAKALSDWLAQDQKVLRTESAARAHAVNYRKAIYGQYAAELTKRYDTLYVELMSFKDIVEGHKDDIREQKVTPDRANRHHQASAAAEFLQTLKTTAKRTGCDVVKRKAATSTSKHWQCGTTMVTGPQLMLQCPSCGVYIDQDENAARNLLSGDWPEAHPEDGRTKRRRIKPENNETED